MARVKPPQERRREERQRTRLRSGKIVNLDGRFVVECQFIDIAPMERRSGCGRPYTCRNDSGSLTIIMRARFWPALLGARDVNSAWNSSSIRPSYRSMKSASPILQENIIHFERQAQRRPSCSPPGCACAHIHGADFLGGNIVELLDQKILDDGFGKPCIEIIDDRGAHILEAHLLNRLRIRITAVELMEYFVADKIFQRHGEFLWIFESTV